jgi:predicted dehydrogenase
MKALAAGKHVLLEKPSANTAEETRKMFAFAQEKNLVLLEAFHYRYDQSLMSCSYVPILCWTVSILQRVV